MCILLKEEIKTGEAKICQKKVWSKYLKYERGTTTKYIIYGLQDYNTLILNTIIFFSFISKRILLTLHWYLFLLFTIIISLKSLDLYI